MTILLKMTMFSILLLMVSLPPAAGAGSHAWRYIFPFFPAELDVLIGHLRTTIKRLEEVLKQCKEMAEGEWEGDISIGVMGLAVPTTQDNGKSMEEKVKRILELREKIGKLEDEIEECRFEFWTGEEV